MIKLGDYNTLKIVKSVDFGLYLTEPYTADDSSADAHYDEEILLPQRYVTPEMKIGDELEVFLYLDHEERLVATTEHPIAKVGEFA